MAQKLTAVEFLELMRCEQALAQDCASVYHNYTQQKRTNIIIYKTTRAARNEFFAPFSSAPAEKSENFRSRFSFNLKRYQTNNLVNETNELVSVCHPAQ